VPAESKSTQPNKHQHKKQQNNKKGQGKGKEQMSAWKRFTKFLREIVSELKKVDWPPMKKTKNNEGVLANTGIVLVLVAFFLVIITAFDLGLFELLRLLTGISA